MKRAFFIVFLLWANPAIAGDWRFLGVSTASSRTFHAAVFIDVASVERHGNIVRSWLDERLSASGGSGRYQFNRIVELQESDCGERKYRSLSSSTYLDAEFKLDALDRGEWKYAVPDSYKYQEIGLICASKWSDKPLDRDRAAKLILDGFHDNPTIER